MLEDAIKWNERYKQGFMPSESSAFVIEACGVLKDVFSIKADSKNLVSKKHPHNTRLKALDIACGNGRHSKILASLGFCVESVDISQIALENLSHIPHITPICADLDTFSITQKYDVILNSFFLDRRQFMPIINALNPNGIVLFETFIDIDSSSIKHDKALYMGELEQVFSPHNHFEILHSHIYENTRAESAYRHIIQLIAHYKPKVESNPIRNTYDL